MLNTCATNQEPITINQEPITNNITTATAVVVETDVSTPKRDAIPYQKIVDLYHNKLPMCPRVKKLNPARKAQIRGRWNSGDLTDLKTWGEYFDFVAKSRFLTGMTDPPNGRQPFIANLEWLTRDRNFTNVWEQKYHG